MSTKEAEGCSVKTTGGEWCHFPFTYRGKVYSSCTTDGHYKLWCSTTDNYDQHGFWGNCAASKLRLVLYLHKSYMKMSQEKSKTMPIQFCFFFFFFLEGGGGGGWGVGLKRCIMGFVQVENTNIFSFGKLVFKVEGEELETLRSTRSSTRTPQSNNIIG